MIIKLTLDYQDSFNQDLKNLKKVLSELKENFSKLEVELTVTKQVNNVLYYQIVQVELKSCRRGMYVSIREFLEIRNNDR